MHDTPHAPGPEDWVVWNGGSGLLAMAALGRVQVTAQGRLAWLAAPFEMVGPFSLDELQHAGRIAFAACLVMSRPRWQADQAVLRQQAQDQRRAARDAANERLHQAQARHQSQHSHPGQRHGGLHGHALDERPHREALHLPTDGPLRPAQIKAAFRRLAQKAHPDVGGNHEQFVRLTQARNALLGQAR